MLCLTGPVSSTHCRTDGLVEQRDVTVLSRNGSSVYGKTDLRLTLVGHCDGITGQQMSFILFYFVLVYYTLAYVWYFKVVNPSS